MCTYSPFLLGLHPIFLLSHSSRWSQSTEPSLLLAICFIHDSVYISMLLSQFFPPSPSPAAFKCPFSTSVSLFLLWKQVHLYHFSWCSISKNKEYNQKMGRRPKQTSLKIRHTDGQVKVKMLVTQLCPTLCHLMDCNPPDSSVHGILQARILVGVAVSFSRESSQSRDRTQVSCVVSRFFAIWATREAWERWPRGTVKRCSTSLIIREMQVKTTMRYYLTQVRMTFIKKSVNDKC